jgi:hypothetical protein
MPADYPDPEGFRERMHALLTIVPLPPMSVDLATWRRLQAMRDRLVAEDPTLANEPDSMKHVVYAAICGGLSASELENGVSYNENTGLRER